MEYERYEKYDFFEDLLVQVYNIDECFLKKEILTENTKLNIDLFSLSRDLESRWPRLFEEAQDYSSIQKKYLEDFLPWQEKYTTFIEVSEPSQLSEFIHKFYIPWTRLEFESRNINRTELEDLILRLKPRIKSYFKDSYWGYKNFIVFKDKDFHIILHLALLKHKTETFSLKIIFSIWSGHTESENPFRFEDIQLTYRNSMIAYDILNKLKTYGYTIDTLKYQDKNEGMFGSTKKKEFKDWPTTCAILVLLNINPLSLIIELKNHLYQIDQTINEIIGSTDFSPSAYYKELPKKIMDFLIKGKEYLKKIEDILAIDSPMFIEEKISPNNHSKDDDKLVELLGIFREILEKDKVDDSVNLEDKGFRTLHKIINLYQNRLTFSPPTYYKYMKKNDLSLYFEHRRKEGIGAGDEYRYREKITEIRLGVLEADINHVSTESPEFLHERLKIQEAFENYNIQKFNGAITIFENLLRHPSDSFKANSELFIACLFYLGRSYFKIKNYSKALQFFERVQSINKEILNANYYKTECKRYLGNIHQAVEEISEIISDIGEYFKNYHNKLDLDIIFRDWYRAYQLKSLHPDLLTRDLFSQRYVFYNKSIDKIKIDIYLNKGEKIDINEENFKRNMVATRSLFKILFRAIILKMELLRRIIFSKVIEGKEEFVKENINLFLEFIISMKRMSTLKKFNENFNAVYIYYLTELLNAFNYQKMKELVSHQFLNKTSVIVPGVRQLLKSFDPVFSFLTRINMVFHRFNQYPKIMRDVEWKNPTGDLSDSEPILKAEYLFIQTFLNHEYVIKSIIENESNKRILEKEDLYKFHGFYPKKGNPRYYLELSEDTYKFCKENNIKLLLKRSHDILKDARVKYKEITDLLAQLRTLSMNHYLKNYYGPFQAKTLKITLDYMNHPKNNITWFVIDELLEKVSEVLSEKHEKIQVEINLFNSEILDELIEVIKKQKNFIRYPPFLEFFYGVKLNFIKLPDENKLIMEVDIYLNLKEDFLFEEKLDSITEALFFMLESNREEMIIKFNLEDKSRLEKYFKEKFISDFKNDYFLIEVNLSYKNKYLLRIKKRELF